MQCMWILNINDAWKKNLVKNLKIENFSILISWASIEYQSSQTEARLEKSGNFQLIENHTQSIEILKTKFFEKLQKIMQKLLKPRNFMNEMHENEFKCFSKTWVFNLELQNKVFNHRKKLTTPKF